MGGGESLGHQGAAYGSGRGSSPESSVIASDPPLVRLRRSKGGKGGKNVGHQGAASSSGRSSSPESSDIASDPPPLRRSKGGKGGKSHGHQGAGSGNGRSGSPESSDTASDFPPYRRSKGGKGGKGNQATPLPSDRNPNPSPQSSSVPLPPPPPAPSPHLPPPPPPPPPRGSNGGSEIQSAVNANRLDTWLAKRFTNHGTALDNSNARSAGPEVSENFACVDPSQRAKLRERGAAILRSTPRPLLTGHADDVARPGSSIQWASDYDMSHVSYCWHDPLLPNDFEAASTQAVWHPFDGNVIMEAEKGYQGLPR